jgi:hypothetical protein
MYFACVLDCVPLKSVFNSHLVTVKARCGGNSSPEGVQLC